MIHSINPTNNEIIASYKEHSASEIEHILLEAENGFKDWKTVPFSERAKCMNTAAEQLILRKAEFSRMMVLEMGKTFAQAESEVEKCAWVLRYYAENSEKFLEDEIIETDAQKSFVTFQPLGVILAVMPWNFPLWQVFRFAAPTLMAGNAAILKHASNVTGCALLIEDVFCKSGLPNNLFKALITPGREVSKIITNPIIKAVSLTGSTAAGISVATAAGSVLKKCVLELGGSDPYIVFGDADIEKAAEFCVFSRLINAGQSCIAAKRFIIVEEVYSQFEEVFLEKMKSKKMGDPFDKGSDLGPQARVDLRDELSEQVHRSVSNGARLLLGGIVPETSGAWYPPTVLSGVLPGNPAFDEEIFGPAAALIKAGNELKAIELANMSSFGLGASIFTSDLQKGEHAAKYLVNAGSCFVNTFVKSDPRLPFGGINESGYGRELSAYGIKEFVNIKTVFIK